LSDERRAGGNDPQQSFGSAPPRDAITCRPDDAVPINSQHHRRRSFTISARLLHPSKWQISASHGQTRSTLTVAKVPSSRSTDAALDVAQSLAKASGRRRSNGRRIGVDDDTRRVDHGDAGRLAATTLARRSQGAATTALAGKKDQGSSKAARSRILRRPCTVRSRVSPSTRSEDTSRATKPGGDHLGAIAPFLQNKVDLWQNVLCLSVPSPRRPPSRAEVQCITARPGGNEISVHSPDGPSISAAR